MLDNNNKYDKVVELFISESCNCYENYLEITNTVYMKIQSLDHHSHVHIDSIQNIVLCGILCLFLITVYFILVVLYLF